MASLFSMSEEIRYILSQESEHGELSPTLIADLERLQEELPRKVHAIACYVKELEADEAGLKALLDQLALKKQRLASKQKRLKEYALEQMEVMGIGKVEGDVWTIKPQTNGGNPAIKLLDGAKVPVGYEYHPPVELDKEKVLADHKAGKPLPAEITISRGKHLSIR